MGFKTGLIVGVVIGWILYQYVPPQVTKSINKFTYDLLQKLKSWVTSLIQSKTQTSLLSGTSDVMSRSPDNLKKIEGIGPKIAEVLSSEGIQTYNDLASADIGLIKGILEKAGSRYRTVDPSTWPEQAVLASQNDWDGLKKLMQKLKGGRRTK